MERGQREGVSNKEHIMYKYSRKYCKTRFVCIQDSSPVHRKNFIVTTFNILLIRPPPHTLTPMVVL